MCSRNEAQDKYWEKQRATARAWQPQPKPEAPRARITLWTANGVQLSTYTCPMPDAYGNACKDLEGEAGAGYVTVAPVAGGRGYRITRMA